ncbi:MAG: peptide/nickel transport system permease protein [Thermotogaceae bacterium]|jgi:peptide/nickel transport system permease protein|nr:peptide/nickel transport system permease protein [Thermotogaceae bacterium]
MLSFAIRRLLTGIITVFAVSLLSFFVFNALPGNPAQVILGLDADQSAIENLERELNLDKPVVLRYFFWLGDLIKGDLGDSTGYKKPVTEVIISSLPPTLSITILSLLLTTLISFPLGILSAKKHNKFMDYLITSISQIGLIIPGFWLGILFLLLFSVRFHLFPSGGYVPMTVNIFEWLKSIILPALSLAIISSSVLIRMIRSSIIENMNEDYARTATGKGVSERRVFNKHILKNAMIPVLSVFGLQIASILAGTIIIESVFSIPGIGRLLLYSVQRRDLPVVQGVVIWMAVVTILINFIMDMVHMTIDPRIR